MTIRFVPDSRATSAQPIAGRDTLFHECYDDLFTTKPYAEEVAIDCGEITERNSIKCPS